MYKILGADGRQYGPVNLEQLRRWIAEGRANASTQTLAEGAAEWKPLGSFPEVAPLLPLAAPPAMVPAAGQYRKTNPWALWGLICGIVSVVFCWCCCFNIPLGVLGLIFSLIGLSEINEFPNIYEGRALAIAGIVVSGVALLLALFVLLANAAGGNFHTYHWHYPRY